MNYLSNTISISVNTRYLAEHSHPEDNRYVFAYDITIRNNGEHSAQLLSRHWIITDGNGKTQEVRGSGVVGEQPVIDADDEFSYSSGTLMTTAVGSMQGSFTMRAEDGEEFEAPIAPFGLAVPGALH
ncbi:Co2+/Mg2+ efflux protein ApaG [Denitrificimonas caeni]|uniref:Protein ApaG n=1 Tax=Denitrificimonas caeni TaxID=521720 RepID=A0AAE9VT37_9GAMM|nr:Co2+/Mg2+ efflux protein ApaG [Denitrificimonas caeni]NLJ11401.1 Co2+/Mg2+ efflux protein ApaG [Gammaproteobacteria bacterium]WBE25334.1 Co2+/Mg2+ efflux protein ApaG [Denitrificimonas caeni]